MTFRMRACRECDLRFPAGISEQAGACPACSGQTTGSGDLFNRHAIPRGPAGASVPAVSAVLDNLRSAWNVGSIFRTADAAGICRLYLCGITPSPKNPAVLKTSLGAERTVPWSHHPDGLALVGELAGKGHRIWALEGGSEAEPIQSAPEVDQVVWVVGNENAGVDPAILSLCERVFYLPMAGEKESLNVVVAFGAAVYSTAFR